MSPVSSQPGRFLHGRKFCEPLFAYDHAYKAGIQETALRGNGWWLPSGSLPRNHPPRLAEQHGNRFASRDFRSRIVPMPPGVFISLRCARRRAAVHPASAVRHRRRLTQAPASRPCSATGCLAHVQEHGVVPLVLLLPLPPSASTFPTMAWPPAATLTCSTMTFC